MTESAWVIDQIMYIHFTFYIHAQSDYIVLLNVYAIFNLIKHRVKANEYIMNYQLAFLDYIH